VFPVRKFKIVALSGLLVLAGCGGEGSGAPTNRDPLSCFPKEAQRWIARTGAKPSPSESTAMAKAKTKNATIYVDRSGSMVGYLKGATNLERPLQDLVSTLPTSLELEGMETAFRTFGTTISDELPLDAGALLSGDAFICKPGKVCDNSETRLDAVLNEVQSKKHELAVIISDLWFTNSEIESTGIASLQPALTALLTDGKAIAIYGIDAPFNGKIYDLPKAGTGIVSVPYVGRHPLYVMVIGDKQAVLAFEQGLRNSGSKGLAEGRANGRIVRSLFSVDPGPINHLERQPLSNGQHPRVQRASFAAPAGVAIQKFVLKDGALNEPGKAAPAVPQWTGPKPEYFLNDAVWSGPTETRTRVWMRNGETCTSHDWVDQGSSPAGWSQEAAVGGQRTFSLSPDRFGAMLSAKGVYLLTGETRRLSVDLQNPATAWMRGPWNLAAEQAEEASRANPQVFPTLNLSEFARIMEAALAKAAQNKNQPIIGFSILVKVEG